MINSFDISGTLAVDAQSVDKLRLQAKKDPDQALKAAARQFEALFMNMLLKSMREAAPRDGPFNNEQTRFYTSMLDQQLAQTLSTKGIGLADIMIAQLSRSTVPAAQQPSELVAATAASAAPVPEPGAAPMASREAASENDLFDSEQTRFLNLMLAQHSKQSQSVKGSGLGDIAIRQLPRSVVRDVRQPSAPAANSVPVSQSGAPASPEARDFVNMLRPHARAASQATGIPAHFVVAQAALESGWGKREIRRADGSQSFNLFGIKAGRSWSGPVVETVTTEYVNGVPQKAVERFRAYGSYTEGLRDYANLLLNNPRYAAVLNQQDAAGFARGLQQAGYATDPLYADKLMRILKGNALGQSLSA